jgi:hypothetical protein
MNTALLAPDTTQGSVYMDLTGPERDELLVWQGIMGRVFEAADPQRQMEREAAALQGKRGFSLKNIQRKYYELREGADWTCLVSKRAIAKAKAEPLAGLPPVFVEYWHGLCLENQRKIRPAYRLLVRQWMSGDAIPGYGTWRDWWRKSRGSAPPCLDGWKPPLPNGWSYQNLFKHKPTAAVLKVAREGRKAMAAHRPLVLKTRQGMEPGQMYMYDDVWWDNRCRLGAKDVRPLELGCVDVASAYQFAWGMRPLIEDDWSKKKQGIKDVEMRYLVAAVLTQHGFHNKGVVQVVEHGTAAISEKLEALLHDMSGGLIKVQRGGMEGCAFADQFRGQSTGNSRSKALKESLGNLVHNEAGNLPAQMGMNRQHKPEQLYGLQEYNNRLMLAASQLPQKYQEALIFPVVSWNEFMHAAGELYANLHDRTDHNLEGWDLNDWIETQWRILESQPWASRSDYLQIPMDRRAAVDAVLAIPGNTQTVRLSPRQVWQRHQAKLIRLPSWASALILGESEMREQIVRKDHTFAISESALGEDALYFPALITDRDGKQRMLPAGEKYAVHFNPFDAMHLTVSDAQGRILGVCKRDLRANYLDTRAMTEATKEAAKIEAELLKPYYTAARREIKAKKKMHEQNASILAAHKAENEALPQGADADIAANVLEQFGAVRADDENWN